MSKNTIKLIVSDIDNTLLPEGKSDVSSYTYDILSKALQKGYQLFICTGRHYTLLPKELMEHIPTNRIGTINGACVTDRKGHTIKKFHMSEEQMLHLTRLCKEYQIGLGFKFEESVVTYANYDIFAPTYVPDPIKRKKIINCDDTQEYHMAHGLPLGAFLIGEERNIEKMKDQIPGLVFAWSCHNGYDVFLENVNKSTAVEYVLEELGLTWDNVIAFGDAGNDIAMIQKAKIGIAMGNAKEEVKKVADKVAYESKNDGVAKMIEEIFL